MRNPYTHYMSSASSPSLKLLGTQGVGDVFDGVTETVCIVVGGVDAPVEQKHKILPTSPSALIHSPATSPPLIMPMCTICPLCDGVACT